MHNENHPRRCKATKRDGTPCARWAIAGGSVCPAHGGSTGHIKKAAQRRLRTQQAEADAQAILAHAGITQIASPLDELGKVASEVLAFKDALAQRVNALNALERPTAMGTIELKAEVALYERALDRSGKFLDMLAKHNFEGHRIRIAEEQARILAGVVQHILHAAQLTPEQRRLAEAAAVQQFRALEGQAP